MVYNSKVAIMLALVLSGQLSGCAVTRAPLEGEAADQALTDVTSGDAELPCGLMCAYRFGANRSDLRMLYDTEQWRLASPAGAVFVFGTATGRPSSHANIRRALRPVMECAGIAPFGLHAFRHFYASLIIRAVPPKRAQALLGHSSVTMTFDLYGHLFEDNHDHDKLAAIELNVSAERRLPFSHRGYRADGRRAFAMQAGSSPADPSGRRVPSSPGAPAMAWRWSAPRTKGGL